MNKTILKKLRICAISDLHGQLPFAHTFETTDITVICGDTVPLNYQRSDELTEYWFSHEFRDWIYHLPTKYIFMIAGNHDFWMFKHDRDYVTRKFQEWFYGKVVYVEDYLFDYKGITIYGCPWCTGPYNWAFCPGNRPYRPVPIIDKYYDQIPDCDILITHQPPNIGDIGTSYYWTKSPENWGSDELRIAVKNKKIGLLLCGHVHSGQHARTVYPTPGCETVFYNVSLLNEEYKLFYEPRYLEIDYTTKEIRETANNL